MPASTPALLVLFSRNHNYIAERLLEINERGGWQNPPPSDPAKKASQEDELFNTARAVNCGWFMNTIFGDYLASILGLVREGNSWSLDPLSAFRSPTHEIVERGSGNIVSVEVGPSPCHSAHDIDHHFSSWLFITGTPPCRWRTRRRQRACSDPCSALTRRLTR